VVARVHGPRKHDACVSQRHSLIARIGSIIVHPFASQPFRQAFAYNSKHEFSKISADQLYLND